MMMMLMLMIHAQEVPAISTVAPRPCVMVEGKKDHQVASTQRCHFHKARELVVVIVIVVILVVQHHGQN